MKIFLTILKICFVTFLLLGISQAADAAAIDFFEFASSTRILKINGSCDGRAVAIHLMASSSTEPVYSAGAICRDNRFDLMDHLGTWNIKSGDYAVRVYDANSPLNNPSEEKNFLIEDLKEEILAEEPPKDDNQETEEDLSTNFWARFIKILLEWLENAVLKIKEIITGQVTTSHLCLGETCLDETKLKSLLKEEKDKEEERENGAPEENSVILLNLEEREPAEEFAAPREESASSSLVEEELPLPAKEEKEENAGDDIE